MHLPEKYQDQNSFQYFISGTGPKLLLLNGAFMGYNGWDLVRKELEKTHTVIGLDFPNQGNAELDHNYDCQLDYAMFAADFIKTMKWDAKEISVNGLSFGANVARIMATELKIPFKKLILTGATPPFLFPYMNLFQEHLLNCLTKGGVDLFSHEMALHLFSVGFLAKNPQLIKTIQDRFQEAFLHRIPALNLLVRASLNYRKTESSYNEEFHSPVYIVSLLQDMMVPHLYVLEYAQRIQAEGFYEIQSGHFPFAEAANDYNRILIEILSKS